MTPKQRLLSAIKGQPIDRVPWSPFLAYWFEAQSKEFQARGQLAFLQDIGADPLLRGFHQLFNKSFRHVELSSSTSGDLRQTRYETPVGTLTLTHKYVASGNTWFLTEHPVKEEEDLKILAYVFEDMLITPDYEPFLNDYKELGENGLYVPCIGADAKSSFQGLVEHWIGTQELCYMLADFPEAVEECLEVMRAKSLQSVMISLDSPAEALIFWEDSSTTNISPAFFERYAAPEISNWADLCHRHGKLLVHHACGHIKALLPLIAATGVDVIESISPPPTGNIELWDAIKLLPESVALIGGIEPTQFLNLSPDQLEIYVKTLLDRMAGRRFVLANSDSCPPGVTLEKFRLVTQLVK